MSERRQRHHTLNRQFGQLTAVTPARSAPEQIACPNGEGHDVRMEWEMRDGLRTGRLVTWCWTCRLPIAPAAADEPIRRRHGLQRRSVG